MSALPIVIEGHVNLQDERYERVLNCYRDQYSLIINSAQENPQVFQRPLGDELDIAINLVTKNIANNTFDQKGFSHTYALTEVYGLTPDHSWISSITELQPFRSGTLRTKELADVVSLHPQRELIVGAMIEAGYSRPESKVTPLLKTYFTKLNSPECHMFALSVLANSNFYKDKFPGGYDGNDCMQFWVYGPYVLKSLNNDFELFMQWVNSRQVDEKGGASYPGLEYFYKGKSSYGLHYLGFDGRGDSHTFARQLSESCILPAIKKL